MPFFRPPPPVPCFHPLPPALSFPSAAEAPCFHPPPLAPVLPPAVGGPLASPRRHAPACHIRRQAAPTAERVQRWLRRPHPSLPSRGLWFPPGCRQKRRSCTHGRRAPRPDAVRLPPQRPLQPTPVVRTAKLPSPLDLTFLLLYCCCLFFGRDQSLSPADGNLNDEENLVCLLLCRQLMATPIYNSAWLAKAVKVYMKRENAGSWNSGLENEQILETYYAQLQKVLKLHEDTFWN
ncbi:myosin tail region-interacting protein MTI1 [Triticum aestivum]|uniref:myosin tail region-interacting protein MTI1 n=1 Tax=Triticum aestivum TaxID=4565 RepID=UPI001D017ACA|nr:myosin tail region-interacting protein MTI1-like [Triticum aestivum]